VDYIVMPLEHFLRRSEVERATGLKHTRLYELIKLGRFPRPVRISEGAVAWIASEIASWQANCVRDREQAGRVRPETAARAALAHTGTELRVTDRADWPINRTPTPKYQAGSHPPDAQDATVPGSESPKLTSDSEEGA
jgi:prophage regulatory protein